MKTYFQRLSIKHFIFYVEISAIIIFSFFPLLFDLPYRDNIYLSWEGAYRLYLGQIPYADFGLPLGFGFWIIPAIFFKIFGPYLFTLVKAQVFINILSLIAFRNILKLLGISDAKRFLAVFLFILSYSFPNFWPWYNHTVFVFQLISLNFVLYSIFGKGRWKALYVICGGLFSFLSFYTKQDSGAISIVFSGVILLYHSIATNQYRLFLTYCLSVISFALVFILPFLQYDFLYWFNYGQAPHDSRISLHTFFDKALGDSQWEKFYILLIVIAFIQHFSLRKIWSEEKKYILLFLGIGMILQAFIIKVTSPLPTGHYSYFHAFAFAFLISTINLNFRLSKLINLSLFTLLIFLWWSPLFWDYASRVFKFTPSVENGNVNYSAIQTKWVTSNLKAFKNVRMPETTIEGIKKIKALDFVKEKKDLKVLNMSEITPLAVEIGYEPLTNQPLWYHLHIGMFEKQVKEFNNKIKNNEYDLVLFQPIPELDNFFPYAVQEELKKYYELYDTFEAPRKRSEGYSYIEVYIKKDN